MMPATRDVGYREHGGLAATPGSTQTFPGEFSKAHPLNVRVSAMAVDWRDAGKTQDSPAISKSRLTPDSLGMKRA